jgi:rfaE bifunctional protein kinase chain/domain
MTTNLDFFDRVSVLIVGDVMLDRYLWGEIRRISPEAPVPIVEIDRETHTPGGAANVANNLAALGVRCELFGVIGDDQDGEELQTLMQQKNVLFDKKLIRKTVPTITKTRIVAQRQQICRLDKESLPERYTLMKFGLLDLLAEKAASYDAIILSDYAKGVISQPVIDALREVRNRKNIFLALDPKPQRPMEISGLDLLTPNHSEGIILAGLPAFGGKSPSDEEIVAAIHQHHCPKCLVMTLGDRGMLLRNSHGQAQHFPSVVHQVADVSGAGDTVIATLTAAMAAGISPEESVNIANIAAGVVVGKLGTATLTRDELTKAFKLGAIS